MPWSIALLISSLHISMVMSQVGVADWAEHSAGDESGRTVFDSIWQRGQRNSPSLHATECPGMGKKCRLRCSRCLFSRNLNRTCCEIWTIVVEFLTFSSRRRAWRDHTHQCTRPKMSSDDSLENPLLQNRELNVCEREENKLTIFFLGWFVALPEQWGTIYTSCQHECLILCSYILAFLLTQHTDGVDGWEGLSCHHGSHAHSTGWVVSGRGDNRGPEQTSKQLIISSIINMWTALWL